jgi:cell division protein FtsI/penicillin-binding protein 2
MVLEGTPLQVARAYAGLATGELPCLSFTRDAAGSGSTRLPIAPEYLAAVQDALKEVARTGSAKLLKDLDLAAKTGSADYAKMTPEVLAQLKVPVGSEPARRKHTWVAGWTPADDPRLIFVVYLHDVGVTSTHSAVFVARQLLKRPEVRAYLAGGGS